MTQIHSSPYAARPTQARSADAGPSVATAPAPAPAAPVAPRQGVLTVPVDEYRAEQRPRQFQGGPSLGQSGVADPRGLRRDSAAEPKMSQQQVSSILTELRNLPMPPAPAGRDLADPAAMDRDQKGVEQGDMAWKRVDGELFVNGPSMEDPKQGWLGDCYLVAAMGAVANVAPDKIQDMMRKNDDGTVTVQFKEVGKDGKATTKDVTVDPDQLLQKAADGQWKTYYGSSHQKDAAGRPETWVPMMEKAFAQAQGGYEKIGNGGFAGQALEALTGVKSQDFHVGKDFDHVDKAKFEMIGKFLKKTPEEMQEILGGTRKEQSAATWDWLKDATSKKDPVVATTYYEPGVLDKGIMPMHAYTVAGVEEKDGKKMVTLRNPAPYIAELEGNEEVRQEMLKRPDMKALADLMTGKGISLKDLHYGTFQMPLEDFQKCFSMAYRAPLSQKA